MNIQKFAFGHGYSPYIRIHPCSTQPVTNQAMLLLFVGLNSHRSIYMTADVSFFHGFYPPQIRPIDISWMLVIRTSSEKKFMGKTPAVLWTTMEHLKSPFAVEPRCAEHFLEISLASPSSDPWQWWIRSSRMLQNAVEHHERERLRFFGHLGSGRLHHLKHWLKSCWIPSDSVFTPWKWHMSSEIAISMKC